jgi:hypothetical protein
MLVVVTLRPRQYVPFRPVDDGMNWWVMVPTGGVVDAAEPTVDANARSSGGIPLHPVALIVPVMVLFQAEMPHNARNILKAELREVARREWEESGRRAVAKV